MAVVQISRIQVRRGKENSGSGLPQLASGEMAWGIDSQNLYIGNGSVAEGAPYVGNTKILTANDLGANGNILDLITYQYKKDDYSIQTGVLGANYPYVRATQSKLDENPSIADFGAVGDGVTDNTATIQLAINQLFLNPINVSNTASRVKLFFPAGTYIVSSTIYIPSYATLEGVDKDKTIIQNNGTGPVFQFVNDTASAGVPNIFTMSTVEKATYVALGSSGTTVKLSRSDALNGTTGLVPGMVITGTGFISAQTIVSVVDSSTITISGNPDSTPSGTLTFTANAAPAPTYLNQPRNITIKNMTLFMNTAIDAGLRLDAVRDSRFENISITGSWANAFYATSAGIIMTAFSRLVTCQRNIFKDVGIGGFGYGVLSNYDIINNTFQDMYVYNVQQGFAFGPTTDGVSAGQLYGPCNNEIADSRFENVKQEAVYVTFGTGNTTRNTRLYNVGNNGGSNRISAAFPQIYFGVAGNASINDQSDRPGDLATTVPYINTTYTIAGSSGTTLVVASTTGIYQGMAVTGTGFDGTQLVSSVTNSTTLVLTTPPATTPSGTLTFSVPYYPEVSGYVSYTSYGMQQVQITNISSPTFAFRLPIPTDGVNFVINYVYRSTYIAQSRRGVISVMCDTKNQAVQLTDEYDWTGTATNDVLLQFSAQIQNNSLVINYSNTATNDTGVLLYSYSAVL